MIPLPRPERRTDVLIVDASQECRDVLRTLLERRGMRTSEAAEAEHGLAIIRRDHPQVIVLDVDAGSASDERISDRYREQAIEEDAALVVLGRTRRPCPSPADEALPRERIVAKPYHYAPLIRTIEQLLRSSER